MEAQEKLPLPPRRGALGKALIVWLASGSFVFAVIAYFVFSAMGC